MIFILYSKDIHIEILFFKIKISSVFVALNCTQVTTNGIWVLSFIKKTQSIVLKYKKRLPFLDSLSIKYYFNTLLQLKSFFNSIYVVQFFPSKSFNFFRNRFSHRICKCNCFYFWIPTHMSISSSFWVNRCS